jgi:pilus assembly protein CpaF
MNETLTAHDGIAMENPLDLETVRQIARKIRPVISQIPGRTARDEEDIRKLAMQYISQELSRPDFDDPHYPKELLGNAVLDELFGFGPIQDFLNDATISEIMVNGAGYIFVERKGVLLHTTRTFESDDQILLVVDRMLRSSGRRVDQSSPMVDARLPDGSRLNVILPPLAIDGPSVTIRKFLSGNLTTDDLIAQGSLSEPAADFLQQAVGNKMNILVSGGTGTGKTTILNILSSYIGRNERVVTIEDAVELTLHMPNLVRLESRPSNSEGVGEVEIRDLVRNSLRMRPDRIVVGEVRGSETIDMLQAMNTGHEGSLSTVHANSTRDALRRLETMILLSGAELPLRAIREQVSSSIDLIVHLARDAKGRRFIQTITEVVGMEGDLISTADLFERDLRAVDTGILLAPLLSTGVPSQRIHLRAARSAQ